MYTYYLLKWLEVLRPDYFHARGGEKARMLRDNPTAFYACELFTLATTETALLYNLDRFRQDLAPFYTVNEMHGIFAELVSLLSESGQYEFAMTATRYIKDMGYYDDAPEQIRL